MSFMEKNGQPIIMISLLLGSFMWLMIASMLFLPPVSLWIGGAGYFTIIIGGFGAGMLYTRERYNKYPYIKLLIRPENYEIPIFLHPTSFFRMQEGGNVNAAHINLAFPRTFPKIGDASRIVIHYTGDWAKRVHYRPMDVDINGFNVPVPQGEILEVVYAGNSRESIEYQDPIPIFRLRSGSADVVPLHDYQNVIIPTEIIVPEGATPEQKQKLAEIKTSVITSLKDNDIKTVAGKVVQLFGYIQNLTWERDEERRRALEWQSKTVKLEDINRQQKAEILGLLSGTSGIKERALEWMLPIYNAEGTLEKAIKRIKGSNLEGYIKYIVALVAFAMVVIYFYYNPQVVQSIFTTLNSPMVLLAVVAVAIAAIFIVMKVRGGGGGKR